MNYEKALSLYKNDKTLQLLRAEHFPLLVSFFHLVFKQQDRISYLQTELQSILGDYIFSLQRLGIDDYQKAPVDYLQKWAEHGYLRRYYERADEPVYELSPATENALKWLEDLNKQQFVGTHSRLIQFFNLLQRIVNTTSGPYERIQHLQAEREKIDREIEQIRQGNYAKPSDTQLKENYFLAEETAKRLLSDFRQVEENFRELDSQTRQTIIKSNLAKADLLDNVFQQQDFLWNTDQGKSFKAFWEFLMSEQMQEELEDLLDKINAIPAIAEIKKEQTVDRIKTNLVDAGDKVNRSNDGLIEQLRKFVEQKNLSESRHILQSIEEMESLLLEHKETLDQQAAWMEIDEVFKPSFTMDRPLFNPPVKAAFTAMAYGKGFDFTNLTNMRKFFLAFPILDAVRQELSWTHYRIISRVENQKLRLQYVDYAIEGNWNTRTLQRNIDSQYLGRLLNTSDETKNEQPKADYFIKDPYIFEFLGLPTARKQNEGQIETALITHLQQFLMELGKGFAFVARQQHIVTDTSDFFIDLVFYNYYLKCFVLLDLKTNKLSHEAIGQMDMYVRMYNDLKKGSDDNPTVGIILCTEKDETIVKYSVLAENEKLFASKYRLYLPDEEELKQLIEADQIRIELDKENQTKD